MARELAVVLANGSIQSAVCCALAAQKFRTVMLYVETSPNSGQVGAAFDAMVQHFKPYRSHRVAMPFLATIARSESSLATADPRSHENATSTLVDLVPVVSIGLRLGVHYGAAAIYCGLRVGGDSSDCAKATEFTQLWTEMAQMTLERPELEVVTPLLELDFWQVVDLGVQLDAPFHLTWSCETLVGEPCGECRRCREREAAFQRAGRADPARAKRKSAV